MTAPSVSYVSDRRAAKVVPVEAAHLLERLARAAYQTKAVPSEHDVYELSKAYGICVTDVERLIAFAAEDHRQQATA